MSAALDFGAASSNRFGDTELPGWSCASRADLRRRLADAAESIIALLDALDGDPDTEDDGTAEPSLGWTRTMAWGCGDDREEDRSAPLWGD